ncbi:MAG TPA: hypothetical protein VMG59_12725 [Phycisphaerae bacterium]|nr:hypothetical protein [Phycisphaerae bacterium]
MYKLNPKISEFWLNPKLNGFKRVLFESILLCQYPMVWATRNSPDDHDLFTYVSLGGALLGLYLAITGVILSIWRFCRESSFKARLGQTAMTTLQFLLVIGFIVAIFGYLYLANKYGPAMNADRMARKLPIIPPGWKFGRGQDYVYEWINPDYYHHNMQQPMYFLKRVRVDELGNRISEEDDYIFKEGHGEIDISYDFQKAANRQNPWTCYSEDENKSIKLTEAEAILKKYGLKRLNY